MSERHFPVPMYGFCLLASYSFADGLELLRGGESFCSAACSALWSGSGEAGPRKCHASKQRLVREEKDTRLGGEGCRTPGLSLHHSLVGSKATRPVSFN